MTSMSVSARGLARSGRRRLFHGPAADPVWRIRSLASSGVRPLRSGRPELTARQAEVLAHLRRDAVAVTSLDELDVASSAAFRAAVDEVLPTLPSRERLASEGDRLDGRSTWLHCLALDAPKLAATRPEIVLFGVDPQILAIVEGYLGVRPALTAVDLRKDIGTGEQVGTRIWHLDTEDHRNIRMIVYLSDVTAADGPFEYLPAGLTASLGSLRDRAIRAAGDPIVDEELERTVPRDQWCRAVGPAGTVAFADNTRLLHHSAVHRSERVAVLFTYTSRSPLYPEIERNARYDELLTPHQRASLYTA